uniref:Uncharacterized protein n=1 Tax=Bursaphelenchus xylophilus TaxID=6326 RepID=A0A1I7SEE3_BURXY
MKTFCHAFDFRYKLIRLVFEHQLLKEGSFDSRISRAVDQRTDSLRSDYEVRLAELLPKHQSELRAEIENFARSIRQELAIQLKSTERTEKSLEVQALHSEIEKLKNDLSKRSEGLEEDIYSKISKILLQLDENQNKRLDEYAERLEKKLKNAQADPNEALAALHEQYPQPTPTTSRPSECPSKAKSIIDKCFDWLLLGVTIFYTILFFANVWVTFVVLVVLLYYYLNCLNNSYNLNGRFW